MKKNILIFCTVLATFSLMAFSYMSRDKTPTSCAETVDLKNNLVNNSYEETDLDLVYNISSRFIHTISKEDLHQAKSIIDILPSKATESITAYYSVRVSILEDDQESDQQETGNSEVLNAAQIKLLQTTDYSNDFYIRADYQRKNGETTEPDSYLTYFISIVPEKKAVYGGGQEALIKYLRDHSKKETAIIKQDKLQPGKVSFTVTKKGTITNVKLTSTSGYHSVDDTLVELITNMPEKWDPATNSKGEKVDQSLVFFFGLAGC